MHLPLFFLLGLVACAPFQAFTRSGAGIPTDPYSFTLKLDQVELNITTDGRVTGALPDGSRATFQLPVQDGHIVSVFAAPLHSDIVFVYELDDWESGWGVATRVNPVTGHRRWRRHLPSFNLQPSCRGRAAFAVTGEQFERHFEFSTGKPVSPDQRTHTR